MPWPINLRVLIHCFALTLSSHTCVLLTPCRESAIVDSWFFMCACALSHSHKKYFWSTPLKRQPATSFVGSRCSALNEFCQDFCLRTVSGEHKLGSKQTRQDRWGLNKTDIYSNYLLEYDQRLCVCRECNATHACFFVVERIDDKN